MDPKPRILVFTTVFPSAGQPHLGLFIRERMFRVGKVLPLAVVAPVPWFPLQGIIRRWRPHFRPQVPDVEAQQGFTVYHPRFFSVPGVFKSLDGLLMALGSLPTLLRLRRGNGFDLIDAHFAYPDGYAATLLGSWLKVPVTITLRGTEVRLARTRLGRRLITTALARASGVFAVAEALKRHAMELGIEESRIRVIGNGVDTDKFRPVPRGEARRQLGLPPDAPILITVGGLVERKGFHRVIECLPELKKSFPDLRYLIAGGAGPEGDFGSVLRKMISDLGLADSVHLLGQIAPDRLKIPLSGADAFVLATRNEGWANVLLEAMACGLPVIATDVGGNAEVISRPELGTLVPFGDRHALERAITQALTRQWDRNAILAYARENTWEERVSVLVQEFTRIAGAEYRLGPPGIERPQDGRSVRENQA